MTVARTIQITYGSWNTGLTGVNLTENYKMRSSREEFSFSFTVFIEGDTVANFKARVRAMTDALQEPDQDFTITEGGSTFYQFSPYGNTSNTTPGSSDENCTSTLAKIEQLDRGRSDTSSVFKITVEVERFVENDGSVFDGIVVESAEVSIGIRGNKEMTYSAEYTGNPQTADDAEAVYNQATYGFDDRAAAFQTLLGGTWERVGPIELDYDISTHNQGRTIGLTASALYREEIDSVTISYDPPGATGAWTTADTGFDLWGAHGISETQDNFTCIFDVVVTGSTHAQLVTRVETMLDAIHAQNGVLQIYDGSDVYYKFDADQFTAEAAQQIRAEARLLQEDRAELTRVYQITFDVSKVAQLAARDGIRSEQVIVQHFPDFNKIATIRSVYTPFTTTGDALDVFADGTVGFEARKTVLLAAIDSAYEPVAGKGWEQIGPVTQEYDHDERFLTVEATYRKILYNQLDGTEDSDKLVDISYTVDQIDAASESYPGTTTNPIQQVRVFFQATVPYFESDGSTTVDMKTVLRDSVVPYVTSTVSKILVTSGTPILTQTNLTANPVNRQVSGTLDYIAYPSAGALTFANVQFIDKAQTGQTLAPVFDGTPWSRNKYQGPGSWFRTVVITGQFVGLSGSSAMDGIEQQIRDAHRGSWHLVEWDIDSNPSEKKLGGQTISTTTQVRTLVFEYGIVGGEGGQRGGGQGAGSTAASTVVPRGHGERE